MATLYAYSPNGTQATLSYSVIGFTQSLQQNGWCKLPNGLILQWGCFDTVWKGSNNIKFLINYSSNCAIVISTSVTSDGYNGMGKIVKMELTNFNHKHDGNAHPYYYLSIGY